MATKKNNITIIDSATFGICDMALTLDTRYCSTDGKYHDSVKYTVNGARYYYHVGSRHTPEEFSAIARADGRGRGGSKGPRYQEKCRLLEVFRRQVETTKELDDKGKLKTIANVRAVLTGKVSAGHSPSGERRENFLSLWRSIIAQKKASTAETYKCALDCFVRCGLYRERDGFNVDTDTVREWVSWMQGEGYTQTTIGMYLRAIRVCFRTCIRKGYIREADYPFGSQDEDKVRIPVGGSRKTSFLTVEQMTILYRYFEADEYPAHLLHPDLVKQSLGLLLAQYLCNGCNLYDLALLRYDDYHQMSGGRAFRFFRHKTKDHADNGSEVIVPVTPPLKKILSELAAPETNGGLVFPFLLGERLHPDSKEARNKIHMESNYLMKRMRNVAEDLGWETSPSSTYARHSFATNLSQQEVPLDYISFAMGHSVGNRGNITKRYISPYPLERMMEYNSLLLDLPEFKPQEKAPDISDQQLLELIRQRFGNKGIETLLNGM